MPPKAERHTILLQRGGNTASYLTINAVAHRSQAEGVNHNLVAICRLNGMPAQQAFDHVNTLLIECYRDWYLALADLPQWGEQIDVQVQRYIQGVQDAAIANINWRFVITLLQLIGYRASELFDRHTTNILVVVVSSQKDI